MFVTSLADEAQCVLVFRCGRLKETDHFLSGCGIIIDAPKSPFFFLRAIARVVQSLWRERSKKLFALSTAPVHSAGAREEVLAVDVDRNTARKIATDDIRFYHPPSFINTDWWPGEK